MSVFSVEGMSLPIDHRPRIAEILRKVNVFNEEEISVALDLFDRCLAGGDDYQIHVAVNEESRAIGYVCFGRRPLTDGVYDLYWIAVDPVYQRMGVGRRLLASLEEAVGRLEGRMILAETSSRDSYWQAREFYAKNGFDRIVSIDDFYAPGDSLLIYQKGIDRPSGKV